MTVLPVCGVHPYASLYRSGKRPAAPEPYKQNAIVQALRRLKNPLEFNHGAIVLEPGYRPVLRAGLTDSGG
jgi:hypothetical protein